MESAAGRQPRTALDCLSMCIARDSGEPIGSTAAWIGGAGFVEAPMAVGYFLIGALSSSSSCLIASSS